MSPTTTPPEQVDPALVALVQVQAAARARATAQAVATASASARQFTGWYDTEQITAWATSIATQIEALQRFLAQTTDAYLARARTQITGRTVRPIGRIDVAHLRAGITHAGAYGRAADTYRWQQYQFDQSARSLLVGTPEPFTLVDPIDAAIARVARVADLDAQLAVRAQSQAVMTASAEKGVTTGYRRVIHPEESRGGSCGLCVAASDRLYAAREPLPIHSSCHCTTLPVVDGRDPGSALNRADLNRLYKTAGGTHKQKLAAIHYQIDDHGELGPVLNPKAGKVRTLRDVRRDTDPQARRRKTDAEKAADIRRIRDSLAQALPKAQDLAGGDPKRWGVYLDRLRTRIHDLDQQIAA